MKRGKPLTREESRARTRELVLEAAEEVFLANGFLATTVAQIAANAARTTGSIYSHFPSKEALCQALLERHYGRLFAEASELLARSGDDLEAKIEMLTQQWRILTANDAYTTLVVEYAVAVRRDPEQYAQLTAFWELLRGMIRAVIADASGLGTSKAEIAAVDAAFNGIVSSAIGLAAAQTATMMDAETAATSLAETARIWMNRLQPTEPTDALGG
ncbi:TetR/AcrR family transcriptional regulator [Nocardia sp. CA-128927]|uniref:TetR/AcrR family transcriptional regulator n=1 Tax=Nocardia sp. CA-128927 TaxID=3239975 RepID=UPI003D988CA7